jgi:hypothetical protein
MCSEGRREIARDIGRFPRGRQGPDDETNARFAAAAASSAVCSALVIASFANGLDLLGQSADESAVWAGAVN